MIFQQLITLVMLKLDNFLKWHDEKKFQSQMLIVPNKWLNRGVDNIVSGVCTNLKSRMIFVMGSVLRMEQGSLLK